MEQGFYSETFNSYLEYFLTEEDKDKFSSFFSYESEYDFYKFDGNYDEYSTWITNVLGVDPSEFGLDAWNYLETGKSQGGGGF